MRRSQEQSGGQDSVNVQAGGNSIVHLSGVTVSEVRDIALDVFRANFLTLRGVAEEVARDRAARITLEFLDRLQKRNPSALESVRDPDMLRTLYTAQEGYACSGEEDLEQALIDVLVDRAGQKERDLKTLILNEAIAALPKLTAQQRAALTACFSVRHTRYIGPFNLPSFYRYLSEYLAPFAATIPVKHADYLYMQSAGVGSLSLGSLTLEDAFYQSACGFFANGFTHDEVPEEWRDHVGDPSVFMPCLRNQTKMQIKARSETELEEMTAALPSLAQFAATGRMQPDEIKADLISNVAALAELFHRWKNPGPANFDLTAVGIAIGHACQRQLVTGAAPLETFLV